MIAQLLKVTAADRAASEELGSSSVPDWVMALASGTGTARSSPFVEIIGRHVPPTSPDSCRTGSPRHPRAASLTQVGGESPEKQNRRYVHATPT